ANRSTCHGAEPTTPVLRTRSRSKSAPRRPSPDPVTTWWPRSTAYTTWATRSERLATSWMRSPPTEPGSSSSLTPATRCQTTSIRSDECATRSRASFAYRTDCPNPAVTRSALKPVNTASSKSSPRPGSPAFAGPPKRRSISCMRPGVSEVRKPKEPAPGRGRRLFAGLGKNADAGQSPSNNANDHNNEDDGDNKVHPERTVAVVST